MATPGTGLAWNAWTRLQASLRSWRSSRFWTPQLTDERSPVVGTLLLDATFLWSASGDRIRLWEIWTWLVVTVLLGIAMWISADGRRERRIAGVIAVLGVSGVLAATVVFTVVGIPWS
jgi:hypothetical protein